MPSGCHLTYEDLSHFIGFRLPSNKADRVYEHMRECTECDSRYWFTLAARAERCILAEEAFHGRSHLYNPGS